ncbi:Do family serine endopeptidase [Uliginosibacterium gangwonense]|uniref:Do family serine endopeptidase n=1 Tax=Uliginosibacterium gangwonense TaxID=392736 RepID=UPI0003693CB5|nr:Do family serine endopeptidase [Uliginosibacterium gangwonense]
MIARVALLLVCFLCQGVAQAHALPEFASLVEQQAPVVVNVSATRSDARSRVPALRAVPDWNGLPEWLRRLTPGSGDSPPQSQNEQQDDDDGPAQGSGFVVSTDGYVLTNAHVVEDASEILVRLFDRREYLARLVGMDKRTDIALLKLDVRGLRQAHLGSPANLRVGDWVLAIGSPFGFDSTVTAGIVSAKGRWLPDESIVPFIQTDVAINPGNSGGPLFNLKGEVVGINSQIYSQTGGFMGLSFSIPIDVAMDVAEQLRVRGHVRRGRIGVQVQELTFDMAESLQLRAAEGAMISMVEPNGPASRAGLHAGDVILRVSGKQVVNSNDLPGVVGSLQPGSRVVVNYWRAGKALQASLLVDEFPEERAKAVKAPAPIPRGANPLGLVVQEPSREQKHDSGLDRAAAIKEVAGVAARSELRPGDLISGLIVGGKLQEVASAEQLNRAVGTLTKGTAVTLLVHRGNTQSFVAIRIPAVGGIRN